MKNSFLLIVLICCSFMTVFAQSHTSFELPAITSNDVIIKHLGYTLSYNEKHEQANWVAYELTAEETQKGVTRTNDFRSDNAVKTGSAKNDDYQGSGYDRGHMAPATDMRWSVQAMEESFFYSNMSPQVPGFNRGIWKKLEERVRQWAVENTDIYVVTGPILTDHLPVIGPDKVSVPRYYFKVILDYTLPELKGIAFIMPNASSTMPLQSFAVPIDSVEHVTGINFFPALPDKQEQALEKTICIDCWSWSSTSTHQSGNHPATTLHSTTSGVGSGVRSQCSAITQAGNRCKRMTTNVSGICTQHETSNRPL
ncbi:MAG: DNA/RNA non-specific endonuclease [Paludibacter sp.]|nr:DNA/RNA non-specific endonuclease [Paludibacter sp.]